MYDFGTGVILNVGIWLVGNLYLIMLTVLVRIIRVKHIPENMPMVRVFLCVVASILPIPVRVIPRACGQSYASKTTFLELQTIIV